MMRMFVLIRWRDVMMSVQEDEGSMMRMFVLIRWRDVMMSVRVGRR